MTSARIGKNSFTRVTKYLIAIPPLLLACVCLLPPVLILLLSLFADGETVFPPRDLSLARYCELFHSMKWGAALWSSFRLCVPSALVCVAITLTAVIALERGRARFKPAYELLAFAPILVPGTALAIGLYLVFLRFHWIGNLGALILVEAVNAVPVTFVVLRTGIRRIDPHVERAAASLGASRLRVIVDVTLPILLPAVTTALIFAFLAAFDDALFVTFLHGKLTNTVSAEVFNSLRFRLDPLISPLSALFMVLVALPVAVVSSWRDNR